MDNLVIRGEPGGEVASVKSNENINRAYRELGIRQVVSLNTFATEVLSHLDVNAEAIPVRTAGFTGSVVNVIFKKPTLLISLASELGIPLTGELKEQKDSLMQTATAGGKGIRR